MSIPLFMLKLYAVARGEQPFQVGESLWRADIHPQAAMSLAGDPPLRHRRPEQRRELALGTARHTGEKGRRVDPDPAEGEPQARAVRRDLAVCEAEVAG